MRPFSQFVVLTSWFHRPTNWAEASTTAVRCSSMYRDSFGQAISYQRSAITVGVAVVLPPLPGAAVQLPHQRKPLTALKTFVGWASRLFPGGEKAGPKSQPTKLDVSGRKSLYRVRIGVLQRSADKRVEGRTNLDKTRGKQGLSPRSCQLRRKRPGVEKVSMERRPHVGKPARALVLPP